MRVQEEPEELDPRAQNGRVEGSIISVPDGPTLAAHEISTLSFTQAFAIYKVIQTSLHWALGRMSGGHLVPKRSGVEYKSPSLV